jgi:hypothetical protein
MQPGGSFPVTPRKYSVDRARNKRPSDNRFQWRLCQEGQRYGARDAKQLAYWARKDAEKPSDAEAQRVNAGRARGSAAEAITTLQLLYCRGKGAHPSQPSARLIPRWGKGSSRMGAAQRFRQYSGRHRLDRGRNPRLSCNRLYAAPALFLAVKAEA